MRLWAEGALIHGPQPSPAQSCRSLHQTAGSSASRGSCKTVTMDADQDTLHPREPVFGASRAGDAGLGPISPELALIDPELAQRARELLPEPAEPPKRGRPLVDSAIPKAVPQREEAPRRRRWPRALALAIVIFFAGAASGTLLGNHETGSPATTLEVRALAPTARPTTAPHAPLRPPKVSTQRATATTRRTTPTRTSGATTTVGQAPLPRQRRRHAPIAWATNVLGVEVTVARREVALLWQRPAGSARVVVVRKREGRSSDVVYRGRATRYRDTDLRPCTGYRYTIVNYDRRGHRSTGVPTSVVTRCA